KAAAPASGVDEPERLGTLRIPHPGRVAELADAQASGACVRKDVGVQVPPRPPRASDITCPETPTQLVTKPSRWDRLEVGGLVDGHEAERGRRGAVEWGPMWARHCRPSPTMAA